MVRHERGKFLEPEMGNLREHFAFVRNAVGHDDVEGGDAVAGDEQEAVAEVKDFADFAGADFFDAGQIELQNWFVHGAKNKVPGTKFKAEIEKNDKSSKRQRPSSGEIPGSQFQLKC